MVGESDLKTHWRRTLEVFLRLWQETLISLDVCRWPQGAYQNPLRSQGYCGDGSGLSGLHWVCFNGRGPHLRLRQEPQVSSPFLTQIKACLQSWDWILRPRLVWGRELRFPLSLFKGWQASCGAVCGSCGVFRTMNRVASAPSCSAFIHRVALEEVSGHRVLIKSKTEKSGSFGTWHQHEATSRISSWDWPHPEVRHEGREPLLDKAGGNTKAIKH